MRKLPLHIESLAVESFPTAGAGGDFAFQPLVKPPQEPGVLFNWPAQQQSPQTGYGQETCYGSCYFSCGCSLPC
jgi:hypothetical protein